MTRAPFPGAARMLLGLTLLAALGCGGQKVETKATATAPAPSDAIAITLTEHGFQPEVVTLTAGQPVKLVVTRVTERTCATEFVMKEHHINKPLPLNTPVEISFTPSKAGELRYACAMDMISGKVVVK